ncbi:hypothetical protein M3231_15440 [Neobacillus mesonae]|nr:hypothetical protein [Neobacillus mesonae]
MIYRLYVCREVWGTIDVEANNEHEAVAKFNDGDYASDFRPDGKMGNECAYRATLIKEEGE